MLIKFTRSAKVLLFQSPVILALAAASAGAVTWEELPDWSGVWERVEGNVFDAATVEPPDGFAGRPGVRQHPPLTDAWEAKYQANMERVARDRFPDPLSYCGLPAGYPRLMGLPDVYEFVVRPEQTWILSENGPNVMRIYTDGRTHPAQEDIWLTFTGDSVGHWESETLVFTTVSMIGEARTIIDRTGMVLSDQASVQTRMQLTDDELLRVDMVIEDPVALTEPWLVTRHFRRLPDGTRVYDYACEENNRNPVTQTGQTLTLGTDGIPIDIDIEAGSGE
jgi:hypothetical protein